MDAALPIGPADGRNSAEPGNEAFFVTRQD
jgi:hypothetical protein